MMMQKQYQQIQMARTALLDTAYAVHKTNSGNPRQVTRLRDLINHKISRTTEKDYERRAAQFAERKQEAEQAGRQIVFKSRTDLRNCASAVMRGHLKKLSGITPYSDYEEAQRHLAAAALDRQLFLRHYKQQQARKKRFEKPIGRLAMLETLRPEWRDDMDQAMRNSKHYPSYVVARATGCRPSELAHGVRVERAGDNPNEYLLHVHTSKKKSDKDKAESEGADRLRIIRSDDQRLDYLVGRIVLAETGPFSTMFRTYAREKLGMDLSPYALRYAMAADAAAAGWSLADQAELLGHQNDKNARTYIAGMNTKAGSRPLPARVEKARVFVQENTPRRMPEKTRERLRYRPM